MARPRIDPNIKKVPHVTRIPQWLKAKLIAKTGRKGEDNQSVHTMKALMFYNQWEEPK